MKRVISLFLSVVMLVSIIASIDLSAYATGVRSEFEMNQYMADYLSDLYNGECVSLGDSTVESKNLNYYSNPENASPAQILYKAMLGNTTFMAGVASWKTLTFSPSNITDDMLDEKGYYEAIIFNILNSELNSSSFSLISQNSISKLSISISKGSTELLKDFYQIDYDQICNKPWNELTPDVQFALSEQVGKELYKWDSRNSNIKELSGIIDTTKTVKDYIETAAKYGQLSKCAEDVKAVLYDLYQNCSSTNIPLKTALYEAYSVCGDAFNAFQVDLVNGVLEIGNKAFGSMVDTMWKACISSLASGSACGLLIGQTIGKGISNFLFSSDAVVEQFFVMQAVCEIENLLYSSVNRMEQKYISDDTVDNAKIYLKAIDMLFSTKELGSNYAIEFADIVYTKGIVNQIANLAGPSKDYVDFVNTVTSINNTIKLQHEFLLNIENYKYYIEVDYPDIYKLWYNSNPSSTSRVSNENIVIADNPNLNTYILKYKVENGSITITGYDGIYCGDVEIPAYINGYPVTKIESRAFENQTGILSIKIPNRVAEIGFQAFSGCTSLENLILPESLTTVGNGFINNTAITKITIPKNVATVNMTISSYGGALDGCTALKEVIFEEGMTKIPNNICYFYRSSSYIERVTIPSTVTEIGQNSFYNCNNISEVNYNCKTEDDWNLIKIGSYNEPIVSAVKNYCHHFYIETVTEPTCTERGYTTYYCEICKTTFIDNYTETTGHNWVTTIDSSSDCTCGGTKTYVCKTCGERYAEYLPASGHTFVSKAQPATCQSSGYTIYTCSVCGYSYKTDYTALGEHNYIDSVTRIANCIQSGKITHTCSVCGDSYVEIIPMTEHIYESVVISPTPNKKGYTKHICSVCGDSYIDSYTDFIKDTDTLLAAIEKFSEFDFEDYSEASYNNLKDIVNKNKELINTAQSQEEIDFAVTEILEAIYDLEPYLNFTVSAENANYEVTCDGSTTSNNKYSLLFGTEITLSATANEGYEFVGWYDITNNLYFSKESTYTFKLTENTNLKAVFVKEQSASLTFTTYSNWVQSTVTKTIDEWNNITSIEDSLPQVPYKYGYSNGRWVYDNDEVLAKLRAGESVFLIPEYDEDDTSLPTPRESENGVPALDLYYKLDADANVGSFVMAAGIPDDCQIESVGIAFYYKKANEFDPTKFELLINNKMLVSRFNTDEIEDIYIVNLNKLTSTYNWAVRGYVTYYDADGNLKTAYSNQVNIVNREQV